MSKSRHHRRLIPLIFITVGLLLGTLTAHAELLVHLAATHAHAGSPITLQGVWLNDEDTSHASRPHQALTGSWRDAQGHLHTVRFVARAQPSASASTGAPYRRLSWEGHVPAQAHGLLTLQIDQAPEVLLALHVDPAPAASTASPHEPPTADTPPTADVAGQGLQLIEPDAPRQPTDVNRTASAVSPFQYFRNAISAYEPIYFAVGRNGGATARFQLSFKYRPFSPVDPEHPRFINDWYLGYTQRALWDLHSSSIPFVDVTYNPSLFWAREALWQSRDHRRWLGLNTGAEHQSNGKGGQDSRSLNDLYVQPEFNTRIGNDSTLSFKPRFKYYVATDHNMGYPDTMGYVDWKLAWTQDYGLGLSTLYRRGTHGRNTTQIEASWPLQRTFLHMNGYLYLQYFQGYGETLLGYNEKSGPKLRLGIALVP